MRRQILKSNNGGDGTVLVDVNQQGKIAVDRKGFVPVSKHAMNMTKVRYEHLKMFYLIPDSMRP